MKTKSFLWVATALFIIACGEKTPSAPNAVIPNSVTEEKAEKQVVHPDMIADLGISGMSCEMNCVSSVRKALMKMEGVASFEMEFDAEKDVNHAFVKFDSKVVSKQEMIEAVELINDEAYTVETSAESVISNEGTVNVSEENSATENGPSLSLFSLFEFLF